MCTNQSPAVLRRSTNPIPNIQSQPSHTSRDNHETILSPAFGLQGLIPLGGHRNRNHKQCDAPEQQEDE